MGVVLKFLTLICWNAVNEFQKFTFYFVQKKEFNK
jgi:hypothetical protein